MNAKRIAGLLIPVIIYIAVSAWMQRSRATFTVPETPDGRPPSIEPEAFGPFLEGMTQLELVEELGQGYLYEDRGRNMMSWIGTDGFAYAVVLSGYESPAERRVIFRVRIALDGTGSTLLKD